MLFHSHIMLLVAIHYGCAQGHVSMSVTGKNAAMTSFEIKKSYVNKDVQIAEMKDEMNLLNLDNSIILRTQSSIVHDWLLVCKQLCGAGLGGQSCAAQCTNNYERDEVLMETANTLMKANKDLICNDLCEQQLGGNYCKCKNQFNTNNVKYDHNSICSTFCDNNNIKLDGCSNCMIDSMIKRFADESMAAQSDNDNTATPDWNELCESLCKTGDGGSLCNCDLAPFKN